MPPIKLSAPVMESTPREFELWNASTSPAPLRARIFASSMVIVTLPTWRRAARGHVSSDARNSLAGTARSPWHGRHTCLELLALPKRHHASIDREFLPNTVRCHQHACEPRCHAVCASQRGRATLLPRCTSRKWWDRDQGFCQGRGGWHLNEGDSYALVCGALARRTPLAGRCAHTIPRQRRCSSQTCPRRCGHEGRLCAGA